MVNQSDPHELILRIKALEKELNSTQQRLSQQGSEGQRHRLFLENLGKIDRAIKKETDIEQMLKAVLETVLALFRCDRAWVLYPCDPNATSFRVPMEVTMPGYPGANTLNPSVKMTPGQARVLSEALTSDKPLMYGKGFGPPLSKRDTGLFGVQSKMLKAIYPREGKPWLFGIHQCSHDPVWTGDEQDLFNEIGHRISDGLTTLVILCKLKKNEKQFKAMFEQAAVGVALCDSRTGRFVKVNQKYSDIVGYSMDELYQLSFRDITHPDDIKTHLDNLQRLLENKIEAFTLDKRYFRKDGAEVWGKITVSPLGKKGEPPDYHVSILQDITEQKKAEDKLKNSENKYKNIFNNLLDTYIETDLNGTILELSYSSEAVSGYDREELIGKGIMDFYADKEEREALVGRLLSKEKVINFEADGIHKDGHRVPFSLTARLVKDFQGNPVKIVGMMKNLEERKKAEKNILESKGRYQSIMEASPDPIVTYDMQGNAQYINPAFTRVFGWTLDEIAGRKIDYVTKAAWPETKAMLHRVNRGESCFGFQTQRYDKDRHIIDISMSFAVWKNSAGEPAGSVVILRDITAQKKAEAQLHRVQKMQAIATLSSGIAHDFNNILSGIFGYTQLARMHLDNPDQVEKYIQGIQNAGGKAMALIQQILTISRQSPHKKQPLQVYVVVIEALKLLRATIPKTIEIKETISSKASSMVDPAKIHQVIMNLATNAYHAMADDKGIISVELKEIHFVKHSHLQEVDFPPGRYLQLIVSDTGCGMDSTLKDKIFDPYFTTKESDKGTGLGLAVTLSIIEEYKGKIKVYSIPGQGSSFHVYLPIIEKSDDWQTIEEEHEIPPFGFETVLLVDDDEVILRTTQQLLIEFGYSVMAFSNGVQAFNIYSQNPNKFDIVVTDLTMHGMTGFELSKEILKLKPGQPIILCTGISKSIHREKALSIGITEYLEKPIVKWKMVKAIRSVLDEKKLK